MFEKQRDRIGSTRIEPDTKEVINSKARQTFARLKKKRK